MSIFRGNAQIIPSFTGNPATGAGIQVPAGLNWYGRPYSTSLDAVGFNVPIIIPGVLMALSVRTSAAQPADFPMTVNLVVNGVATALLATIPANSPSGTYFDLIDSIPINAFDIVRYSIINASAFPSAPITGIYMLLRT